MLQFSCSFSICSLSCKHIQQFFFLPFSFDRTGTAKCITEILNPPKYFSLKPNQNGSETRFITLVDHHVGFDYPIAKLTRLLDCKTLNSWVRIVLLVFSALSQSCDILNYGLR